MSEDKLNRDIVRGAHAHALMQNELLQEAFTRLEADYIAAWRLTPARDTDARERLWQAVNVLGKVKDHIARQPCAGRLLRGGSA
ncbi:MAG TPA: hypothetical protein VGF60_10390 [Xanthobacteraceae bacterium]|jgi:hypothetical protein